MVTGFLQGICYNRNISDFKLIKIKINKKSLFFVALGNEALSGDKKINKNVVSINFRIAF